MRDYKRKYQAEYMASDRKPKGRMLKKIQHSVRQAGKKEIKRQEEETELGQALIRGLKEAVKWNQGKIKLRTSHRTLKK